LPPPQQDRLIVRVLGYFYKTCVAGQAARLGFTLAEILITLGIIGVVASLTLPTLIQSHRKQVVENKLQKFYSIINQAVKMSEIDNGDKNTWIIDNIDTYYNTYLKNYLNAIKVEDLNGQKIIYLEDGTAFKIDIGGSSYGGHYYFCPKANDCKNITNNILGQKVFVFGFWPNGTYPLHKNKGVEPYMAHLSVNFPQDALYNTGDLGCNTGRGFYCTKLIQQNGWRIPKNYPFKF